MPTKEEPVFNSIDSADDITEPALPPAFFCQPPSPAVNQVPPPSPCVGDDGLPQISPQRGTSIVGALTHLSGVLSSSFSQVPAPAGTSLPTQYSYLANSPSRVVPPPASDTDNSPLEMSGITRAYSESYSSPGAAKSPEARRRANTIGSRRLVPIVRPEQAGDVGQCPKSFQSLLSFSITGEGGRLAPLQRTQRYYDLSALRDDVNNEPPAHKRGEAADSAARTRRLGQIQGSVYEPAFPGITDHTSVPISLNIPSSTGVSNPVCESGIRFRRLGGS